MVTARLASGASRTRRPAGPLRLLWLAALLFGFLYTHAAGADSATAHVTGGAVAVPHLYADSVDRPPYVAEASGGHEDGEEHSHPAEACASAHPEQASPLPSPPLVPLGELAPAGGAARPGSWVRTTPSALPSWRSCLSSVVQQV
ncbi:hypothetical protein J7E99_14050 [Streptomyces sp. ISL-44]|uniref:hypothetical protein n=1 Tax=Streptomyces sp. ISL-44 TaxID=2819184 RepID=UPI001BE7A502|nr:hypothetical protein [Streptomyces sp. ISL-44]MBT2541797.1 hypothetical protein [Streptomyces sp. ISL-44]